MNNYTPALTFLDLCAGIGGFSLGLERVGMICKGQVEIDDYCTKILFKHWPHVPKWGDITTLNPASLPAVDLIAGGTLSTSCFSTDMEALLQEGDKGRGYKDRITLSDFEKRFAAETEFESRNILLPGVIIPKKSLEHSKGVDSNV